MNRAEAMAAADAVIQRWQRGDPLKHQDYIADALMDAAGPMPKTAGLTKRQADALLFIHRHTTENGFAPSMREIMTAVGAASVSRASQLVAKLEERGAVTRLPGKARSVAVVTS